MEEKIIKLRKNEFLGVLKVAKQHLDSAELLLKAGQFRDSISRSYYVYFDLVAALLATKGLIPKTHGGALQLYGLHFVKPGIFPKESSRIMSKLMEQRQKADYGWTTDFSKSEAKDAYEEALDFFKLVKDKLSQIEFEID